MSVSATAASSADQVRSTGIIGPTDDIAVRAARAIADRRLDDAARHIRALPDAPLEIRFWKTLLRAAERAARNHLFEAESLAWQAIGMAAAISGIVDAESNAVTSRMTARALNQLGTTLRRQERAREALELHRAAHRLRNRCGSIEEAWESAVECALDADLAGQTDDAVAWLRDAVALAANAYEEPACKQAVAWGHLSRIQGAANRHDDAIESANTARDHWRQHDSGAVTAAQADLRLGSALLAGVVARRESGEECHDSALDEAEALLASAEESLSAFGLAYDEDTRWAREQRDFVRRLRADLP